MQEKGQEGDRRSEHRETVKRFVDAFDRQDWDKARVSHGLLGGVAPDAERFHETISSR